MTWLEHPTRFLFFTGKGGVGKTSLSTATAIQLADRGLRVLLVSTDAASNLDEMLHVPLHNSATPVPDVPGLSVLNIDPNTAAEDYRQRVLAQMADRSSEQERATVREQLSGACTTEIATFDEFASLLADGAQGYDHVVFDTAPTGHTLRLLSLPKAWSGFLKDNDRGASCLGPHSGLKMQEARFNAALRALSDPALTTVVLVARPETSALREAARTAEELLPLGLSHQALIVNGVLRDPLADDPLACALAATGAAAMAAMPASLRALPTTQVPLRAFDTVGVSALRALLDDESAQRWVPPAPAAADDLPDAASLQALVDELSTAGKGLIMVMGKGGVGKTSIAAAVALGLVCRGHAVHLSTTDPAAHLASTLEGQVPGLTLSRIDPKAETQRYIDKIMATRGAQLDEQERALLLEDLQSPCTEEVAVFHAFSHTVASARSAFVVLDTAPTGHSLLLMDATGAYHRQMTRELEGKTAARIVTPLMRLQDPQYTRILLVTLPETTPVSQAAALQDDLRRAQIEPYAWILNKSLSAIGSTDPTLAARLQGERKQVARIRSGLAQRLFRVPMLSQPPVGVDGVTQMLG
ncbi:arsenical pump-driving ATPase [Aquabacterium sp.]|uniref:arsenical pump-driving ATPase n=1 Tax=Aquabacterium sp. TaxID=1872578 RepID=UPI0035B3B7B5